MNREAIYAALFALVSPVSGFVTVSRTLRHWNDVSPSEQPALFQAQGSQLPGSPPAPGGPRSWALDAKLYLYANKDGLSPGEVINPLVDAIAALFDPTAIGGPQTLGGRVQWVRIEGAIETDEGNLGSQAVVIIPIKILTI